MNGPCASVFATASRRVNRRDVVTPPKGTSSTIYRVHQHPDPTPIYILAGVSIVASIGLILAARDNSQVSRVVAINPYDCAKGHGMARSSFLTRLFVAFVGLPVPGDTVMRLHELYIMKSVLNHGVDDLLCFPLGSGKDDDEVSSAGAMW